MAIESDSKRSSDRPKHGRFRLHLGPQGHHEEPKSSAAAPHLSDIVEYQTANHMTIALPRTLMQKLADMASHEGVTIDILVNHALAEFVRARGDEVTEDPKTVSPDGGQLGPKMAQTAKNGETVPRAKTRRVRGKYAPLYGYLSNMPLTNNRIALSFQQIEEILEDDLPPAARTYREWWANSKGSQVQPFSWLQAGWEVDGVDMVAGTVEFRRHFKPPTSGATPPNGGQPDGDLPAKTSSDFQTALNEIIRDAQAKGLPYVDVLAGELHRRVGGYPGPQQRLPVCCGVMRRNMGPDDRILAAPPKGNGASLKVRYMLPR